MELLPASSIDVGMIKRVGGILFRLLIESLVCLSPELNAPGGVLMCCIHMLSQHDHVDSHQSFLSYTAHPTSIKKYVLSNS